MRVVLKYCEKIFQEPLPIERYEFGTIFRQLGLLAGGLKLILVTLSKGDCSKMTIFNRYLFEQIYAFCYASPVGRLN